MSLRPRRSPARLASHAIRVTPYRPASPQRLAGDAANAPSPERATILNEMRFRRRAAFPGTFAPLPSTVTPDRLAITLPVPPSINHQYATVNGRRLLSSAGRAYKAYVSEQVWLALAQSPCRGDLLRRLQSSPLALSIRFFFTSALRRDVDGGLKIAQDALCEGLELNDNRIVETHLFKDLDKADPRIEVSLTPAAQPNLLR
jgi:crossover junction endodeoxyribonuclease RusA